MMTTMITIDVAAWSALIFFAFKWATCTCGA
jgi:hypothetical protein